MSDKSAQEVESIESILNKLDVADRQQAYRILYGAEVPELKLSDDIHKYAAEYNFELKAYTIDAAKESTRAPRITRVALIQNSIHKATNAPVFDQQEAIHQRIAVMAEAAGKANCNVLCLQEFFHMPFAMCTRERLPFTEFAQNAETGPTIEFCKQLAAQHNMMIICSVFERDQKEVLWNTVVYISHTGKVLGKSRKNHIPRVGDFNESTYYMESELGHPVLVSPWGKIGTNICYGRHHPQNWMAYALNGAEIIFNPSATVGALSEPLWSIEARNAAIANHVFTCNINRVGTESFEHEFTSGDGKPAHHDFGHFYGSSYIAAPDGRRTPGLSRTKEGLLIADIDVNLCRQTSDKWAFRMTQRLPVYADLLARAAKSDFEQQQLPYDC